MGFFPSIRPDLDSDPGADAGPTPAIWSERLRRRQQRHRRALLLVRPLGGAAAFACLAILFSYAIGFERGYRPWPGGPGTSPLTAITLGLLAAGLIAHSPLRRRRVEVGLVTGAIAIAVLRLAEIAFGISLLPGAIFQAGLGTTPIGFGWNSALGAALSGIALLAAGRLGPMVVQALVGLAIASPLVALVGFSYGLTDFYGRTSLYTATILLTIAMGAALASSRRGIVCVLLDPFAASRLARIQLFGAFAIPYAIGYILLHAGAATAAPIIGLGVISTATFTIILMSVTLLALDRMDRRRRRAERMAYFDATHDHLTGLANRRLFSDVAKLELTRAARHALECSLILVDIDHFKSINDTFGHEAGDHVLQHIAEFITTHIRAGDLAARHGGEEFTIFLPDTSIGEGWALAERLRGAIQSADFSAPLGAMRAVTISAGVACLHHGAGTLDALLRAADGALYAAKKNGRNRVEEAASTA